MRSKRRRRYKVIQGRGAKSTTDWCVGGYLLHKGVALNWVAYGPTIGQLTMLKQILKVGYVDQELLEVLTEEQKDVRTRFVFAVQLHIIS